MIIFDLSCQHEHRFEGWFQSREDFDSQSSRSLISCPDCGSLQVRRVPSALHVGRQAKGSEGAPPSVARAAAEPAAPAPSVAAAASQPPAIDPRAGPRSTLQQLTTMLLADCEDVGDRFAEEARKIHYLEAPERSIRGQASNEEYEALREEGVEVLRVPRLKVKDLH
ncbi:MAG: hypothetical protein AW10_02167 [Candidatus Accumulibacter appositus]|uniref:DUF1178 family protein n=1 Tax=Candidatus Accumulibacter appositus TaxID=1454003 RepID=A0A011NB54_9PROT|nr:DUF1178 family protein [Accumulibacter sp.]EXI79868.1 MAG: hypothetical protein AW10_02167 [Candidatus Accumulibacter appositus]HRF05433.1 DUF1178 family protein [Accumulibacter sp.]